MAEAQTGADSAGGSADGSAASAETAADTATSVEAEQAKIISTGTVSLVADDVRQARNDVQRVADAYAGHLSDEDTTTDEEGEADYARLVLRIPSSSYDQARTDLEGLADLISSTSSSEDVTTEVRDVDERVKSMRASLERLRTLLGTATKISDIMAIESQVTSREADLESLLSQQAYLADQTSLSTITVDISRQDTASTKQDKRTGFLTGLASGWDGLTSFGTGAATVTGVLLPWLVVLALLGTPGWLLLRRRRAAPTPGT